MTCFVCVNCGLCREGLPRIVMVCESCETIIPPGERTCPNCGATKKKAKRIAKIKSPDSLRPGKMRESD